MSTLVFGGIKSGKTRFAEQLADKHTKSVAAGRSGRVAVIATAQALDAEMANRIKRHQAARNPSWLVLEEPLHLAKAMQSAASQVDVMVIDCLTLWLTNLLLSPDESLLQREMAAFEVAITSVEKELILVSNETNLGIIPLDQLSRRFCDEAGLMHQRLAKICDHVVLVVAGLPVILKGQKEG